MEQSVYTDIIMELYRNPPNYGSLAGHNLRACGGNNTCGDAACFEAKIINGTIIDVCFTGEGCAISKAGCAVLTETVKGKSVKQVLAMESKDIFDSLGGIIQTRIKCALLGLTILKRGLGQYSEKKQETLVVNGIKI